MHRLSHTSSSVPKSFPRTQYEGLQREIDDVYPCPLSSSHKIATDSTGENSYM